MARERGSRQCRRGLCRKGGACLGGKREGCVKNQNVEIRIAWDGKIRPIRSDFMILYDFNSFGPILTGFDFLTRFY